MKPHVKLRVRRNLNSTEVGALLRSAINPEKLTPFSTKEKTLEKTFSDQPCPLVVRRKKNPKHPKF